LFGLIEKKGWIYFSNINASLEILNIRIKKLPDTFLNFFINKENSCENSCDSCDYCELMVDRYLEFDQKIVKDYVDFIESSWKEIYVP
jgi:hypothetical protein